MIIKFILILIIISPLLVSAQVEKLRPLLKEDIKKINSLDPSQNKDRKALLKILTKWRNEKLKSGLPDISKELCKRVSLERVTTETKELTTIIIFSSIQHCDLNTQLTLLGKYLYEPLDLELRKIQTEALLDIWLYALEKIRQAPKEKPTLSVVPEKGFSGMNPEDIKDIEIRKKYIEDIKKNNELIDILNEIHDIKKSMEYAIPKIAEFITDAYALGKENDKEFKEILGKKFTSKELINKLIEKCRAKRKKLVINNK